MEKNEIPNEKRLVAYGNLIISIMILKSAF